MRLPLRVVTDGADPVARYDPDRKISWETTEKDTRMVGWLIQYTRIVNYLMPCEEWGGDFRSHNDYDRIQQGKKNFIAWAESRWDRGLGHRKYLDCDRGRGFGSISDCFLARAPSPLLPNAMEAYLGIGSELVPINLAAHLMQMPASMLLEWKLELVLDHLVVKKYMEEFLKSEGTLGSAKSLFIQRSSSNVVQED